MSHSYLAVDNTLLLTLPYCDIVLDLRKINFKLCNSISLKTIICNIPIRVENVWRFRQEIKHLIKKNQDKVEDKKTSGKVQFFTRKATKNK